MTIVGRGEGCQLVLDDPLISRRHACFVVDDREVTLKDLGSTNGVLVNGARVDELQVVVPEIKSHSAIIKRSCVGYHSRLPTVAPRREGRRAGGQRLIR